MNEDNTINIIDVVNIIKTIINPKSQATVMSEPSATYSIENGILFVNSPVALAGVQVQLATDKNQKISIADSLSDFEQASAWLSDNDWLFLAYNMNVKTLPAGKNAIMYIGDARISSICLSDAMGRNVKAVGDNVTGVNHMGSDVMHIEGIYTLSGRKLSGSSEMLNRLPNGVYIINGKKIVK